MYAGFGHSRCEGAREYSLAAADFLPGAASTGGDTGD